MKFSYTGLLEQEVRDSRNKFGSNAVTTQDVETFWDKLIANLKDPIIMILIVALLVTLALAALGFAPWYEGLGIAIAVVLATLVATFSEYSNEAEFQSLLEEASKIRVKVFRDGTLQEILIDELVVNDLILLQPGDNIPADGFLLQGELDVNESALTGESEPVDKTGTEDENQINEEKNALSRAGLVEDGEGVMKVQAVGDKTKYGATMKELISAEDRLSPLQQKLAKLGKQITNFGYIGATLIALAFMFNHVFFDPLVGYATHGNLAAYLAQPPGAIIYHLVTAVILAIIIIVVAVPEGLPMMIAVVLSLNMRKLLRANVLVRKLLGIETSGSLNILFSDKTGTLTEGRLQVASVLTGDCQNYQNLRDMPDSLMDEIVFGLKNNTSASIDLDDPENPKIVGANSTEKALLQFLGPKLAEKDDLQVLADIPFNSAYKYSATQVSGTRSATLVKGASEIIIASCTHYLDHQGKRQSLENNEELKQNMAELSGRAMRLIGLAYSDQPINGIHLPEQLTLISVFGLRDEMRPQSKPAVLQSQQAGIQVVMITGDSKDTAQAIAREVGILKGSNPKILTSTELGELSDDEVKQILPELCVVARALPTDKSRLVKLAKQMDLVVGMTGDGVNDAPAVKNADVGFAMGNGTDMTKESSDIVILDNNFISLTNAVLYGRTLLKSIRKFLIFQLSVNVAAILVAFLGPFFGIDLPLTMTQLLWINIVMDTLAAFAFSGEAALNRYMREKPTPMGASLVNNDMWSAILVNGITIAILSLYFLTSDTVATWFPCDELRCGDPTNPDYDSRAVLLTAFFGFFVFINNFNKINSRTEGINLFEHILENRNFIFVVILIFCLQTVFTYLGGEVLRTVGLSLTEWIYVIGLSFLIIPVDLIRKLVRNAIVGNPVV